jgi:hypothetical protein
MKDTAKFVFYIIFIIGNYVIYDFTSHIQNQEACECRTGWKIENLKMISILSMLMGIINLVLPLNQVFYNIPLISGFFSIGILTLLFVEIFSLVRLVRNLVNDEKCSDTCQVMGYEHIINTTYDLSLSVCVFIAFAIAIGLLYL